MPLRLAPHRPPGQCLRAPIGRRAHVRLREAAEGHRHVTGELVGATDREVTLAAGDGVVSIPYDQIVRSNLVPGD